MPLLNQQLTKDIAQAFHLGLRRDAVSPAEAKELAAFLFGLAHLAEGQQKAAGEGEQAQGSPVEAEGAQEQGDAAINPFLSSNEEVLARLREFLNTANTANGYNINSPLLKPAEPTTPAAGANVPAGQ